MADAGEDVLDVWRAALLAGDVDLLAELYEDDAVYYVPALGIAAKGRTAIAVQWRATFEQWRAIAFDVVDQDLRVTGDLASSWLRARLTVECHEDGRRRACGPSRAWLSPGAGHGRRAGPGARQRRRDPRGAHPTNLRTGR